MAVAALAALVHDVLISVGVYSLFGFEVTPGDRDRVPHDPRLLDLRHHRRVRQGATRTPRRLLATGRVTYSDMVNLSHEPGADAVAEHVDRRAPPDHVAARRRLVRARRDHARGVRPRPAHRPASPARTRRSSSPRRSSLRSRSASLATRRCKAKFGSTTVLSTVPAATAVATLGAGSAPARDGGCDAGRDRARVPAATRRPAAVDRRSARPSAATAQEEARAEALAPDGTAAASRAAAAVASSDDGRRDVARGA